MSDSRQFGSELDDERLTEREQNTASPHADDGGPDGKRQEAGPSSIVFIYLSSP